jgi:hypothetical protein
LGKRGVRPANRNSVGKGLAWAVTFAPRLCSMQNAVMLRLSSPGDRKISHAHAASGVLSTVEGQRTNERNGLPLPVETESVVDDARSRAGRLDSTRRWVGLGPDETTPKKPPRRTRGLGTRDKQVLVNKAIRDSLKRKGETKTRISPSLLPGSQQSWCIFTALIPSRSIRRVLSLF